MSKSPAFQFYPESFISGAPAFMKPLETHVYIWLLCLDWNQNGFVYHDGKLASWCHVPPRQFNEAWTVVSASFIERDGRWFSPRLEQERAKQAEWREKSSKGGKASAQAKANQTSTTLAPMVEPNGQPNGNTMSLSRSLSRVTTKTTKASAQFDEAWNLYPKRLGSNSRSDAERSWKARAEDGIDEAEMLAGARRFRAWCDATGKTGTEFVMQAARFFGAGRHFEQEWAVPDTPPIVVDGVLTEYGERVTRPGSRPIV